MILRIKSIIYICRLNCVSLLPHLRTSGSDIGWSLVFEFGFRVGMVMRAHLGYPIGYSINMLLGLEIGNYFGAWEASLVGVSLEIHYGLMIVNGEGSMVGL